MQELKQALAEVKSLHREILGRPAPDLGPQDHLPFPVGVDPLQHAIKEVQHLKQFAEHAATAPLTNAWTPLADCFVTQDEFIACVELPSVSREDLKVFVLGGECVVRGDRKPPQQLNKARPLSLERPWGPFERRFVIPAGARIDEMKARITGGLLELRIPLTAIDVPKEQKVEVE